jgi:hypothetical protein
MACSPRCVGPRIALSLTWSVEVAVQSRGAAGSNGADGGYNEHRVPGDVWRFEAWPSHMQRGYLEQLEEVITVIAERDKAGYQTPRGTARASR